jgi:ornithine cyclodeaminase/alanine dehydrogenase-like protein (mu-crystallin family)
MAEIGAEVVRGLASRGLVLMDSASGRHEAGDLLQAGLAMDLLPTLGEVLAAVPAATTPAAVLFKSCGSALWDLAAAECAAAVV